MSSVSSNFELVDVTFGPGSRTTKTTAANSTDAEVNLLVPAWSQSRGDTMWGHNDVSRASLQHQEATPCEYPVLHMSSSDFCVDFDMNMDIDGVGCAVEAGNSAVANIVKEIEASVCLIEPSVTEQIASAALPVKVMETEVSNSSNVVAEETAALSVNQENDDDDFVCKPGTSSSSSSSPSRLCKKRKVRSLGLSKNKKLKKTNELSGSSKKPVREALKKGELWAMLQNPNISTKDKTSSSWSEPINQLELLSQQKDIVKHFMNLFAEISGNKKKLEGVVEAHTLEHEKAVEICEADKIESKRLEQLLAQHESQSRENEEKRKRCANSLSKARIDLDKQNRSYSSILRMIEDLKI